MSIEERVVIFFNECPNDTILLDKARSLVGTHCFSAPEGRIIGALADVVAEQGKAVFKTNQKAAFIQRYIASSHYDRELNIHLFQGKE